MRWVLGWDISRKILSFKIIAVIDFAVDIIFENNEDIKINRTELKKLFLFATAQTHFLFDGSTYDQTDGVAMGSPLAPALANLFMGIHEQKWLASSEGQSVLFYKRYVDDIFCVFKNEHEAVDFLQFLNKQHINIKFTMETEVEEKIPFLDITIKNCDIIETSIFRKATFTGLMLNYNSFTPLAYKRGLVKTLIDRLYHINNTWLGFHLNLEELKIILQKNEYPLYFIDNIVKKYLHKKRLLDDITEDTNNGIECRYYKLPYIGTFSKHTQKKLNSIIRKFCKDNVVVKLVFTTCKLKSYLSTKDQIPKFLNSHVVYKFECANCNISYVGETARHLSTRVREHLGTDKQSHVYKHITSNDACTRVCDVNCFSILDRASTKYGLRTKEALHIRWEKPVLNKQVKSLVSTICV